MFLSNKIGQPFVAQKYQFSHTLLTKDCKPRLSYIYKMFHLSLRLITFSVRSVAYLAAHCYTGPTISTFYLYISIHISLLLSWLEMVNKITYLLTYLLTLVYHANSLFAAEYLWLWTPVVWQYSLLLYHFRSRRPAQPSIEFSLWPLSWPHTNIIFYLN